MVHGGNCCGNCVEDAVGRPVVVDGLVRGAPILRGLPWALGDWSSMAPAAIPSKPHLHPSFLAEFEVAREGVCLDLGCGDGRVAACLAAQFPLTLVAVDVNACAVEEARARLGALSSQHRALLGDVSTMQLELEADYVLCQLVLSVMPPAHRNGLLEAARACLKPDGVLLLSVSGDSADINAEYEALYARDAGATHEERTYFSRDAQGRVLYTTHHFTEQELRSLLADCGFTVRSFTIEAEASSRRPQQKAHFYYVVASASVAAARPASPSEQPQSPL
jgi:SAM-dependent methyltransferase